MKVRMRMTNRGAEIALDWGDNLKSLEPAADANQENPRRSYVYAHMDGTGRIFYIGKGTGKRAWSEERHPLWYRYVNNHLNGQYEVRILRDNLSARQAEELETDWIAQCSDTVINWINMGRAFDREALDRYWELREANRRLIQEARAQEASNLEQAVGKYVQAIDAIRDYAFIKHEQGIVGQLLDEEAEEVGRNGEIEALDRLTLCLIKLGRAAEAADRADSYFATYRLDLHLTAGERIQKRVKKALEKLRKQTP